MQFIINILYLISNNISMPVYGLELIRANCPLDKRLSIKDLNRIHIKSGNYLNSTECILWKGYITSNKIEYINNLLSDTHLKRACCMRDSSNIDEHVSNPRFFKVVNDLYVDKSKKGCPMDNGLKLFSVK